MSNTDTDKASKSMVIQILCDDSFALTNGFGYNYYYIES
jgi:hypothetical protein